jgi:hypothetical protein
MAFDFPNTPTVDQIYTDYGVSYFWNGYGWQQVRTGGPIIPGDYVRKAGDTMTGPLSLPAPTAPLHAANKEYVDNLVAAARQSSDR